MTALILVEYMSNTLTSIPNNTAYFNHTTAMGSDTRVHACGWRSRLRLRVSRQEETFAVKYRVGTYDTARDWRCLCFNFILSLSPRFLHLYRVAWHSTAYYHCFTGTMPLLSPR